MQADFTIIGSGPMTTVYLIQSNTDKAKKWLDENVQAEDYQWVGPNLGVEHRYIGPIMEGMIDAGLTVEQS